MTRAELVERARELLSLHVADGQPRPQTNRPELLDSMLDVVAACEKQESMAGDPSLWFCHKVANNKFFALLEEALDE